jgi:beta-glucosidase
VVIDADRALCARGEGLDDAAGFTIDLLASGRAEAIRAAREADVAIVVVGNNPLINGRETEDRADLALPEAQDELLRAVQAANPHTVLVVQSSYPYAIEWATEHVAAILWSSHGGQEFGHALADVLFGDGAPSGRLTQTWYRSAADLPDLLDYDIITADATYQYFRGDALYPFGHGLTYSSFAYSDLACSADVFDADGEVGVSVVVTNTGERASDEVVQLYTRQHSSRVKQPLQQLRGFQRVHIRPGESTTVHFVLSADVLSFWDVTRNRRVVESARHSVMVGRSSADIDLVTTISVRGEEIPSRSALLEPISAATYDDYAGIELRESSLIGGDTVAAVEPGAWVGFGDVDFGNGATTCVANLSSSTDQTIVVTLRLDDPIQGTVIGTLTASCRGGRYVWASAATSLDDANGVHDLYAVVNCAGGGLDTLTFSDSSER